MLLRLAAAAVSGLLLLAWAAPARAELVFFSSGRSLSVKAHRSEGAQLVLELRGGGEIVCDPSAIVRIAPDEVPYPEPEAIGPDSDAAARGGGPQAPGFGGQPEKQYTAIIDKAAARHGVEPRLVRAVIRVESAYQERARSPRGAMGLMQLMPQTAQQYAVGDPYDPVANIEAGIRHLKSLLDRFPLALALAAYNAGEAAVERFHGIPPYPETRAYVARVLKLLGR
jgi:transglycosylase-like protein with SLT domain